MGYPGQNPEDAAAQQRDAESTERDREAYERYSATLAQQAQDAPQKREDEFSHFLHLANGEIVKHDEADGPVPSEVNGVPVASVYPATVGGPT